MASKKSTAPKAGSKLPDRFVAQPVHAGVLPRNRITPVNTINQRGQTPKQVKSGKRGK